MKVTKSMMWKCVGCDQLYDDEQEAVFCCDPPEQVEAYKCGECDEVYEEREEAKECCR